MYTLGLDIGSSAVKVSVLEVETGRCAGTAACPDHEMEISAPHPGWAEQAPQEWWKNAVLAIRQVMKENDIRPSAVAAIGIAYQMHGLVAVDRNLEPLRPAIIWCDSRAVGSGKTLFETAGAERCMERLLNAPGNFTLSKLFWLKNHEEALFGRIFRIMLPGDYIALRMTGEVCTTVSGLSEGIMWDFRENNLAGFLLEAAGIAPELLPATVATFGMQGKLTAEAAGELGLPAGIPVTYRAGDQPNNAFSLKVTEPGETAATAGTSGVVYGVTDQLQSDPLSRVNTFAHVNHSARRPRLGILMCINGTGISNSWLRRMTGVEDYRQMDHMAAGVPAGSDGLTFLPFGNGSERMLENRSPGAAFMNLDFNLHGQAHLCRAVQEGVAFAFRYGMKIMEESGMVTKLVRAGHANMFLSSVFCSTLASIQDITLELYDTDGALGAARGSALGAGLYHDETEALAMLKCIKTFRPDRGQQDAVTDAYRQWELALDRQIYPDKNS
ncbi:MAG TPA: FGGY family carbohydrate kinase [Bacteroidales bacterium]|nr:FGGY family carbohydrate kinase [Bacteroidales bacterium]HPS49570.1 FGGY family carbohydrate kinase [Bacteroidales bacterium]